MKFIKPVYGVSYLDSENTLVIDVRSNFSIWEHMDEHSVHFDTAGSGATVLVSEIPAVISFLNEVLTRAPSRQLRKFDEIES